MSSSVTPPHHPIHGVHVAQSTIDQIIRTFPNAQLASTTPLERGKSYNNRIYFLTISKSGPCSLFQGEEADCEVVLKANGRFFGADKIQNEVGFLRLLQQYCPRIPTPRVLAWSENGEDMVTSLPVAGEAKRTALSVDDKQHGGWILMSRVKGTSMSDLDLDEETMARLMVDLADIVAEWRTTTPAQKYVGSLRFCDSEDMKGEEPDIQLGEAGTASGLDMVVRGILIDGIKFTHPVLDPAEYHAIKIREKMRELQTSNTYARNRTLVPKLEAFVNDTLPRLNISGREQGYVFTHYDLSPRNVLVSGSPPKISGIVDFEFSGFYSILDEFLNDYGANVEDWKTHHYNTYLERLESKGIKTPLKSIDKVTWDKAHSIDRMLENIAPWWLPGPHTGEALEEELKKAEAIVLEKIATLNNSV